MRVKARVAETEWRTRRLGADARNGPGHSGHLGTQFLVERQPGVRERLLAQGHIASAEDISLTSIHRVARDTGFAEVRRLLRQIFKFTADGPQWRDKVLLDRLFELNEALMA
jgi:hypothetical protein